MAHWFGRHTAGNRFDEHAAGKVAHDARQLEASAANASLCAYVGLVMGAVLTHLLLEEFGIGLPRWSRFLLLVAGAAGAACTTARLADLILAMLVPVTCAVLMLSVAALLWHMA